MKSLKSYIQEKLVIKKINNKYNYFPKTKYELKKIIKKPVNQNQIHNHSKMMIQ